MVGQTLDLIRTVEALAGRKGVFRAEAYFFVLQALESAMTAQGSKRHVSGEDLLGFIRDLGRERYGPMTGDVFNSWGVRTTLDFGRIVFHLVDAQLLSKRDEDSLADFLDKFDFQDAFALRVFEDEG
jgi:uncharacterized repeat protein (TIGR04138 family)